MKFFCFIIIFLGTALLSGYGGSVKESVSGGGNTDSLVEEMKVRSGPLKKAELLGGAINLAYENASAVLEFLDGGTVRVFAAFSNSLPRKFSYAVAEKKTMKPSLKESAGYYEAVLKDLRVRVMKDSLRMEFYGKDALLYSFSAEKTGGTNGRHLVRSDYRGERFFGLGEKTGDLELTGRGFAMFNSDTYKYDTHTDPIYVSVPFYLSLGPNAAADYGVFFDNPARSFFSFLPDDYSYSTAGGYIDLYFFTGGLKDIIGNYTALTGRPYLPPIWGFGFHQSRYSYMSQKDVMTVASNFRAAGLPLDVVYLDIDFMSNKMSFTYNNKTFPDPLKMTAELFNDGIRTVAIVDPGIKADAKYGVYSSGLLAGAFISNGGRLFKGTVWPGMCVFPDFTLDAAAAWWGKQYQALTGLGIEGFWNDMNEPSVFSGPNLTLPESADQSDHGLGNRHGNLHNIYGLSMVNATFEGLKKLRGNRRIFLLSRAGYSGSQRYGFLWTGDNTSNWDHLRMNVSMVLNMGLSGIPFTGSDLGGYTGSPNDELFTRWIQLGTFMPFMRDHTEQGTKPQEPYVFKKYFETIKRYMKLRYRILPYIYTGVYRAHADGMPLARPLFLDFGRDYINVKTEYLFGPDILVAPVLEPGLKRLEVILPDGVWQDLEGRGAYNKGSNWMDISIDDIPVFARGGSIIPFYEQDLRGTEDLKKNRDVVLRIYPDGNGTASGELYEDDGETLDYASGAYLLTRFNYVAVKNAAEINCRQEGKLKLPRKIAVILPDGIKKLKVNGKPAAVKDGRAEL